MWDQCPFIRGWCIRCIQCDWRVGHGLLPAALATSGCGRPESAFPHQWFHSGKETGARTRPFSILAKNAGLDFSRQSAPRDSATRPWAQPRRTERWAGAWHYGILRSINQTKKSNGTVTEYSSLTARCQKDSAQREHVVSAPAAAPRWWIPACHCGAPTGKHNYNSLISTILSVAPRPREAQREAWIHHMLITAGRPPSPSLSPTARSRTKSAGNSFASRGKWTRENI